MPSLRWTVTDPRTYEMRRTTIDYGIDLGTTNSAVAVIDGTSAQVIANRHGELYTPSAVWIAEGGRLYVGREARQRRDQDEANCDVEFKLRMGQGEEGGKLFERSGREMKPEELSAEVLKSLKADVSAARGETIQCAVITVPAAFGLPQNDATRGAAELAGLPESPLLQEPVAAALAYGFQDESEREFWLVYDFGGGTFDAAVMQMRDGVIRVVNHAGDNYLGGKLIDWEIVERLMIPELIHEHRLGGFQRGNDRWRAAFARLKLAAEDAKIEVCRRQAAHRIVIEDICIDDRGRSIDFEFELTPGDVREIIRPYVTRSLNLCKKALGEKDLTGKDIHKVLMVGGTTLIPWLRQQVKRDLGVVLDFRIDPITAVACGAAIFAGTRPQPPPKNPQGRTMHCEYEFELVDHEPVGSSADPSVGGRMVGLEGEDFSGFTMEITEKRSQWCSGRVPLAKTGGFVTRLHAERGRLCEFRVDLLDPTGTPRLVSPDQFTYTIGRVIANAPLTHSIGVAMANNKVDVFLSKGTSLPNRGNSVHRIAFDFCAGGKKDLLNIPVVEGEHVLRADRNRLVGRLEIPPEKMKRNVPAGSDIEITIIVDESRLVTTRAFIPLLDEEFEVECSLKTDRRDLSSLRKSLGSEQERLRKVKESANSCGNKCASEAINKIENEKVVEQTESLLQAAKGDKDAVAEAQNRLLDLKAAVDQAEDAVKFPAKEDRARELIHATTQLANEHGTEQEQAAVRAVGAQILAAIAAGDMDLLEQLMEEMESLHYRIGSRRPDFWSQGLEYFEGRKDEMSDTKEAERLIARAHLAIDEGDMDTLKEAVQSLSDLIPRDAPVRNTRFDGTTIRSL